MNKSSSPRHAGPAPAGAPSPALVPVAHAPSTAYTLVWDAPLRVFHWLLALSFAGAYLTAESERWQVVHVTLGYTLAGLVVFRVLWGFIGTRHARFTAFLRGPHAALNYLRSLLRGRPEHHVGHNPAGGLAILGLLGLAALTAATGWATLRFGHAVKEWHETIANLMLALVIVHIAAVLLSSWLHRENLIGAMLHGRKAVKKDAEKYAGKQAETHAGIRGPRRAVAALLILGVLCFWGWAWQNGPTLTQGAVVSHHHGDDD